MKRKILKMLKLIEMIDRFKNDVNVLKSHKITVMVKFTSLEKDYNNEIEQKNKMIGIWEKRIEILKTEL